MVSKLAHAILPVTVVICATVLTALGDISSATGVALIGAAAGLGAAFVKAG